MPIVKLSAKSLHRRARVDRAKLRATTEAEIARQATQDRSTTDDLDLSAEVTEGRMRPMRPIDVAAIRAKTRLSQDRFARAFRISAHTLRNWEQGRRAPEGPARALLLAIERDPKAVMRALRA